MLSYSFLEKSLRQRFSYFAKCTYIDKHYCNCCNYILENEMFAKDCPHLAWRFLDSSSVFFCLMFKFSLFLYIEGAEIN